MSLLYDNHPPIGLSPQSKKQLEIHFTGFSLVEKSELIIMASEAGFLVRTIPSKNLDYLVCGKNAGKAKMTKGRSVGAILIHGANAFKKLLLQRSKFG